MKTDERFFDLVLATTFVLFTTRITSVAGSPNIAADVLERAQCQCSVDGTSGGSDVLSWSRRFGTTRTYKSFDIRSKQPYKFIGCGAHTFYFDPAEKQIGGYPWKFCYTYGGARGCTITNTSRKYSLNGDIAYRFCNGDYDCSAQSNRRVETGELLRTEVLDQRDGEGNLQDWTNCCSSCGAMNGCQVWDFSVESMECNLFAEVSDYANEQDYSGAPLWFVGTPGFDDKPLRCWRRNGYETCKANQRTIFIAALSLCLIGSLIALVNYRRYLSFRKNLYCTNDVTPGPIRSEARTRSSKHGTTRYNVSIHTALLVYRYGGEICRESVSVVGKKVHRNRNFFFTRTVAGMKTIIGHSDSASDDSGFWTCISYCAVASGLLCLFILSLQVSMIGGWTNQAAYLLPGSGRRSVWLAVCVCSGAATMFLPCRLCLLRKKEGSWPENICLPENTYNSNTSEMP